MQNALNSKVLEVVSSFSYHCNFLSVNGNLADDEKVQCQECNMRNNIRAVRKTRAANDCMAAETWGMKEQEGSKLDVMNLKFLRILCKVNR